MLENYSLGMALEVKLLGDTHLAVEGNFIAASDLPASIGRPLLARLVIHPFPIC